MNKTKYMEALGGIALDAAMANAAADNELRSIYARIRELADKAKLGFEGEIGRASEEICFGIGQEETGLRQKTVAFTLDYLQNALKQKAPSDGAEALAGFRRELEAFIGRTTDGGTALRERLEANPELVTEFVQNTGTVLEETEGSVLALEKEGYSPERVNDIFRMMHTLKSEANLLGLIAMGKAFHSLEDLLEKIRSGLLPFTPEAGTIVLESLDLFRQFIKTLTEDRDKALATDFGQITGAAQTYVEAALRVALGLDDPPLPAPQEKAEAEKNAQKKKNPAPQTDFVPTIPELDLSEGASLISEFAAEAMEHLENSEEAILLLENTPDDPEAINRIFRAFHTIKGATGFLNLTDMKTLAHTCETMLDLVRNASLKFDSRVADLTLSSIDMMRGLLSLLNRQIAGEDIRADYVNIGPQTAALNAIISGQPAKERKPIGEIMLEEGIITDDELDEALKKQQSEKDKRVGQILTEMHAASTKEVTRAANIQVQKIESSIKVGLGKVDELVDLVGELVISQTQVMHSPIVQAPSSEVLRKNVLEMDRIMRQLQATAMTMRLVPVKSTFQKMGRIIRDLSRKSGKAIDIVLQGEDTEIDKNMVELVSDPLIHMVRNAADHGVESPDERVRKGKPPTGKIVLSALQKGGNIVIEIRDDGAGLDRERILQKAIEKGLVAEGEHLSDKRIWNLIFAPGFSTAEKVTDISGRGVGMDVVRKNIEQLRGKVEIDSAKDKGSTFSIALPVTLAIIEGIILGVGRERYILPISSVVEFSAPDPARFSSLVGRGQVYKFHDEICPTIAMDELFDSPARNAGLEERTICIFDSDYGRYCLLVDEVLSQQQVVIKSLGNRLGSLHGVSGCAILGDGRIGLILDANGIVNYHKHKQAQSACAGGSN